MTIIKDNADRKMLQLETWVMFVFDQDGEVKLTKCFKSESEARAWWVNSSLCERKYEVRFTLASVREMR